MKSFATALVAGGIGLACFAPQGSAQTAVNYKMLSEEDAVALPRKDGVLGLVVMDTNPVSKDDMVFVPLRITAVLPGSPAAQAGFKDSDQVVAMNGRVFANAAAFTAYVQSMEPGQGIVIDYVPAGAGPEQARRVAVAVGLRNPDGRITTLNPRGEASAFAGIKMKIGDAISALLGSRMKATAPNP